MPRPSSSDTNGVSGPSAFEADSDATITGVEVVGNRMTITTPTSDAAAAGAVGFFAGSVPATMSNSVVPNNTATANAPNGMATVQGGGITNDSDLSLTNVLVRDNQGVANGPSGFTQGGGIWNGSIFGGPTPTLALDHSGVVGNAVSGSPGVTLQGGGIFTVGSPLTLTGSFVAHNAPDQCAGASCRHAWGNRTHSRPSEALPVGRSRQPVVFTEDVVHREPKLPRPRNEVDL